MRTISCDGGGRYIVQSELTCNQYNNTQDASTPRSIVTESLQYILPIHTANATNEMDAISVNDG